MKSQFFNFISEIRSSYWYRPILMLVMSALLATLTISLDKMHVLANFTALSWLVGGDPEGARSLLGTIATAMITIASVTFSMTLVAVTFSGSQLGPRLTNNFMRDKTTQLSLGYFIGVFLYCLLILCSIIKNTAQDMGVSQSELQNVPQLSILVALTMAIIGLVVLVIYIHHVPKSINLSSVVSSIGNSLVKQVEGRFPSSVGEGASDSEITISPSLHTHLTTVTSHTFGYIRVLDPSRLLTLATDNDCILQLESDIGDFVTTSTPLLTIYSAKPVSEQLIEQCQATFAFGDRRNQEQDLDFWVNELIEVIARALSPGINDPYTAINAFDWLYLFLNELTYSSQPSRARNDKENEVRLLLPFKDIVYYTEMIFNKTRTYVCKDYITTMHVLTVLEQLAARAGEENKMLFNSQATVLANDASIAMPSMTFSAFR